MIQSSSVMHNWNKAEWSAGVLFASVLWGFFP